MKVKKSLRAAKTRDKNCKIVRRKGRVFVINKTQPRFKAAPGLIPPVFRPVEGRRLKRAPIVRGFPFPGPVGSPTLRLARQRTIRPKGRLRPALRHGRFRTRP